MDNSAQSPGKSTHQVLYTMFRNKGLILGTFLAVLAVVAVVTLNTPKVYEAEAKLEVGVGRETMGLDPTLMDDRRLSVYQTREYEINQEVSELTSRAQIGEVVDILSPEFILGHTDRLGMSAVSYLGFPPDSAAASAASGAGGPPADRSLLRDLLARIRPSTPLSLREQALQRFKRSFSVSSAYNSSVISLSYRDATPQRAFLILKAMLEIHLRGRSQRPNTAESYSFFSEQTTRMAQELDKTEQQLKAMRARYGVVAISDQKNVLAQRLSTLQAARDDTQAEIAALRAQLPVMEKDLDPQFQVQQARLQSLLARLQALEPQAQQVEAELNALNGVEFQIKELERSADIQDKNLRKYQENLELARINRALEREQITNLTIFQDSVPPEIPISPQTRRDILLGALLGLLAGLGLAFARETFDRTLKTPRDADAGKIAPSVAAIPLVAERTLSRVAREGKDGGTQANPRQVVSWFEALPQVRESFLYLKDDLLASIGRSQAPYILAVTSCRRGEGVSTVAAGLAWALAGFEQQKVLLVDASLHHPGEDRFDGAPRPAGLKELSLEQVKSLAGPRAGHQASREGQEGAPEEEAALPSPFTHPLRFAGLLPTVKSYGYGMVVLDLPSIGEGSTVLKIASQADGILLVVQSEKVRQETALRIRDRAEKMGGRMVGLVLNKRRYYIPRLLYH